MTEEEGRKPRKESEFVLVQKEISGKYADPIYKYLTSGPTNKELVEKAVALGNGDYEIHYVRRKFTVATKTETVVQ